MTTEKESLYSTLTEAPRKKTLEEYTAELAARPGLTGPPPAVYVTPEVLEGMKRDMAAALPPNVSVPAAPELLEEAAIGGPDVVDRLEASVRELRAAVSDRDRTLHANAGAVSKLIEERNALRAEVELLRYQTPQGWQRFKTRAEAAEARLEEADNLLRTRPTQSNSDGSYTAWENLRIAYLNTPKVPKGPCECPSRLFEGKNLPHSEYCPAFKPAPAFAGLDVAEMRARKTCLHTLTDVLYPEGVDMSDLRCAECRAKDTSAPDWDVFIGPCCHGRDPWTRCDDCAGKTPAQVMGAVIDDERGRAIGAVALLREALALLEPTP